MKSVIKQSQTPFETHPPYQDDHLKGELGPVYRSKDGCFGAVFWIAQGPGRLLEQPRADELICILEGNAIVEYKGETESVEPGDVVLWLMDDPPVIFIQERLFAFCVTYLPSRG